MPTKSSFPDVEIPPLDLWRFMFEQKRDFPDDQGMIITITIMIITNCIHVHHTDTTK